MASESELRDLLRGTGSEGGGGLDVDAVVSRARRRRRPRVIAVQALASAALVGAIGTAVVVTLPPPERGALTTVEDAAGGSEESAPFADDGARWIPDACAAPVSDPAGSSALLLDIAIPATVASGDRVPVTITLRNDGPGRLVGSTGASPFVSLARDGIVVWHSPPVPGASARAVDLAPGESMAFETFVDADLCGSEDDLSVDDPGRTLPPAPPGDYGIRAVVVVTTESGGSVLATMPFIPVTIS